MLTETAGASLRLARVCPQARALGLRPGMTLGEAQALQPRLRHAPHEPQHDAALLRHLAVWTLRISPLVEPRDPDTLFADVSGCQRLFGDEHTIARRALGGLVRQGFETRAAIADTVGAAYALALGAADVLVVAPPGQTAATLGALAPAALRLPPDVVARLDVLGVRTVRDLLTLPRSAVATRFGGATMQCIEQALGEVYEPLIPFQPPDALAARDEFDDVVRDGVIVRSVALELLQDLFERLEERGLSLRRLECVLYPPPVLHRPDADQLWLFQPGADGESSRASAAGSPPLDGPLTLTIDLAQASRARIHVARLLEQRLEQVDFRAGVCAVLMLAREAPVWRGRQQRLFEGRDADSEGALAELIDRLANRLGYEAVLRPQLLDDHQPELAARMVSVAQAGCAPQPDVLPATCESTATPPPHAPSRPRRGPAPTPRDRELPPHATPPRPLQLRATPAPIRVVALTPDGPPTWFAHDGREYHVLAADGPERIETAWWRGPDVRRDYFRVACATGEQFWLFYEQRERRWYLHGVFA